MKKTKTYNRIIEASITVFSKLPYEEVPLTLICNEAGISNGSIYNYFKSKEELFKILLEETCTRLEHAFASIDGIGIKNRLTSFIKINLDMAKKEIDLIKIYREGQYRFPKYEQKLRSIYISALEKTYNRTISEEEYLYIMAGIRFINVNFTKQNLYPDIEFMSGKILNGFFDEEEFQLDFLENSVIYSICPLNSKDKKVLLLENGEKLFGKYGYHRVKINDIAEKSGIAVGSFYNFFENKNSFFIEIVDRLKKTILFLLQFNTANNNSLLDTHLQFIHLLITFYNNASYKYQVIRELEFISDTVSSQYFYELEKIYIDTFKNTKYSEHEKKILSNLLLGISHYIGIEIFFTKNIKNPKELLENLAKYLINGCPK